MLSRAIGVELQRLARVDETRLSARLNEAQEVAEVLIARFDLPR